VNGPGVVVGTRARDTAEGRAKIAVALERYVEWCRYTGTPFSCPRGTSGFKIEERELVGATS